MENTPKVGQVWVETVVPDVGDPWERLHFVFDIKEWWLRDTKHFYVLSDSRDGSHQTELDKFVQFRFSGYTVGNFVPCVEQRTLEELQAMLDGQYSLPDMQPAVDVALQLLEMLDTIKQIGGSSRSRSVEKAIKAIAEVANFANADIKKLSSEMWIKGVS